MIVSEFIADFLVKKGIRDVFFVDGSAAAGLIVAVAKNKKLKFCCPLHEQAGAFMVDGYFKASRRLSAMIATSGPGGQNLLNGLAASFYDSCPALYFTGQINSRFIKPNNLVRQWGFQENDIVSMAKPIAKYAAMVTNAADIRYELEKAYYIATSGRPGPVLLDIPMDIQRADVSGDLRNYVPSDSQAYEVDKVPVVLDWMNKAKRPAILLGGGIWLADAVEDVKRLARVLKQVPFFVTWNMIDYYDPKFFGGKVGTFGGEGRNFGIQNCDFLLAIGSRISGRITGGMLHTFARAAKKVIVDIDSNELKYQQVKGDMNVCCDAKIFTRNLIEHLEESGDFGKNIDPAWLKRVLEWKIKYKIMKSEYWKQKGNVNPYVFVDFLSDLMQEGDILVHECGGNCVVTSQAFRPKDGQRVFTNNGNSSLGYSLPAAIGAAIATGKKVNCIAGDGGINFNIQELQTLKYYKLPVKLFIFNNKAFGITKAYRDTHCNSEYAGVDAEHGLSFPDFVKLAKAYGLKALSISDHKELKKKLKNILEVSEPVVCNVNMFGFYDYQPKLGWGVPIEEQYPFLPRDEFRKNMIIPPWPGWENPVYPGLIK
jgi:acetolactate synthase-1/2/3 large subunit